MRNLTDREIEVLQLLADGNTGKEISGKLFISEQTVKHHLTNIRDRLDTYTTVHSLAVAFREGWVK